MDESWKVYFLLLTIIVILGSAFWHPSPTNAMNGKKKTLYSPPTSICSSYTEASKCMDIVKSAVKKADTSCAAYIARATDCQAVRNHCEYQFSNAYNCYDTSVKASVARWAKKGKSSH